MTTRWEIVTERETGEFGQVLSEYIIGFETPDGRVVLLDSLDAADAIVIVDACNAHSGLLAALEAVMEKYDAGISWAYDQGVMELDEYRTAQMAGNNARAEIARARGQKG